MALSINTQNLTLPQYLPALGAAIKLALKDWKDHIASRDSYQVQYILDATLVSYHEQRKALEYCYFTLPSRIAKYHADSGNPFFPSVPDQEAQPAYTSTTQSLNWLLKMRHREELNARFRELMVNKEVFIRDEVFMLAGEKIRLRKLRRLARFYKSIDHRDLLLTEQPYREHLVNMIGAVGVPLGNLEARISEEENMESSEDEDENESEGGDEEEPAVQVIREEEASVDGRRDASVRSVSDKSEPEVWHDALQS